MGLCNAGGPPRRCRGSRTERHNISDCGGGALVTFRDAGMNVKERMVDKIQEAEGTK
jgi:hypothetical protein